MNLYDSLLAFASSTTFFPVKYQKLISFLCLLQPSEAEKDPESPHLINAFELIGMSSCLDLSGFFEKEVSL